MYNLANIPQRIEALRRLSDRDSVYLDDIREEFRRDLQSFIIGETMRLEDGKPVIGRSLYKRWLDKIKINGFDYEIDFKE
jgi:hypothetical protein